MQNKNSTEDFRIVIASLPDREKCVCEIYYKHEQWVEISQETEVARIQFYNRKNQGYWEFPLETAIEILQTAKKKYLCE
jgi:DNA-directed RNA polymerase specialized sigma subunit